MAFFHSALSRRDVLLFLLGASFMQICSLFFLSSISGFAVISANVKNPFSDASQGNELPIINALRQLQTVTITETTTRTAAPPAQTSNVSRDLAQTSIVAHAPGWTLFRNLYMSNGTLYIVSESRSFPEIRLMTSTGTVAYNTPENIASREPTKEHMDLITPEEAQKRWGGSLELGEKNRVWSVEGNTLLFNDPPQFLRHYYHFVAELIFGVQAFWHGAFSRPLLSSQNSQQHYSSSHPPPPTLHRAILAHSDADGWRDSPGFNRYFLRGAFPSLSVEVQEDWMDRIETTRSGQRAWHFPTVLLTDRSAAHRGVVCGSLTQRTAAEAWEGMRQQGRLRGIHVGGWWTPVRNAIWRFAGVPEGLNATNADLIKGSIGSVPAAEDLEDLNVIEPEDVDVDGYPVEPEDVGTEKQSVLDMPEKIVISYISRQNSSHRKLLMGDHEGLVRALEDMAARRGSGWEFRLIEAEKLTKDEQIRMAAETTILLGVHGNGLTHLVFMPPTRVSTVIEIFYPEGFAHDYQWTTRALGMAHFAVWNDTYLTHPNKPPVNYPDGFQKDEIPVHGPTIAKLIEDRVDGKL